MFRTQRRVHGPLGLPRGEHLGLPFGPPPCRPLPSTGHIPNIAPLHAVVRRDPRCARRPAARRAARVSGGGKRTRRSFGDGGLLSMMLAACTAPTGAPGGPGSSGPGGKADSLRGKVLGNETGPMDGLPAVRRGLHEPQHRVRPGMREGHVPARLECTPRGCRGGKRTRLDQHREEIEPPEAHRFHELEQLEKAGLAPAAQPTRHGVPARLAPGRQIGTPVLEASRNTSEALGCRRPLSQA